MTARRVEDAKLHLEIFGQPRIVETSVRVGDDCTPLDLWKTACAVSEAVTRASLEKVAAESKRITCGPGCGACCRQLVPISPLEATALLDVVEAMPEERRTRVRARFAAAVKAMEDAGLLDRDAPKGRSHLSSRETEPKAQWHDVSRRWYALRIACPFLDDESCSIYEQRPMICREYHVTTPVEYCESLDPRTEGLPWPVRMSEVLAATGARIAGLPEQSLPFALALEWAEVHGAAFRAAHDGESMFGAMMEVIEEKWEE